MIANLFNINFINNSLAKKNYSLRILSNSLVIKNKKKKYSTQIVRHTREEFYLDFNQDTGERANGPVVFCTLIPKKSYLYKNKYTKSAIKTLLKNEIKKLK